MQMVDSIDRDIKTSVRGYGKAFRSSTPKGAGPQASNWDEGLTVTEVSGGNKEKSFVAPIVRFAVALAELYTEKRGVNPIRAIGVLPAVTFWALSKTPLRP